MLKNSLSQPQYKNSKNVIFNSQESGQSWGEDETTSPYVHVKNRLHDHGILIYMYPVYKNQDQNAHISWIQVLEKPIPAIHHSHITKSSHYRTKFLINSLKAPYLRSWTETKLKIQNILWRKKTVSKPEHMKY